MPKFLSEINLNQNQLQNASVHNLASAPSSPVAGQIYYDTTQHGLYWWDDSSASWVLAAGGTTAFGTTASTESPGVASSAGTSTSTSRSDHVHGLTGWGAAANVASIGFGGTSAAGASGLISDAAHVHAGPASPTAASTGAVANAGGAVSFQIGTGASRPTAGTAGRQYLVTDSATVTAGLYEDNGTAWVAVAVPSSSAPVAETPGGSGAIGTGVNFARSDHVHPLTGWGAAGNIAATTPGGSSTAGSSGLFADAAHVHSLAAWGAVGNITAAGVANTSAAGSSGLIADAAHAHAGPGFGAVSAQATYGSSSASGSATTVSHSDHAHGTPTHLDSDHAAINLSALAAPTASVSMANYTLTNLASPVNGTDAANKSYVDAASAGYDVKASVRVATTGGLPTNTYSSGVLTASANAALSIDGVTVANGDRILVKNESTAANNGIYTVTNTGSSSTAWVLTRSNDANANSGTGAGALNPGSFSFVESGTSNAATGWEMTTTGTITIGTTGIGWTQVAGAGEYSASAPISVSGTQFSLNLASSGTTGGPGGGLVINGSALSLDIGLAARKYVTTIGTGSATSIVVTHNLNNQWAHVQVANAASPYDIQQCDVQLTSANTATLIFTTAPAANALTVTVVG